MSTQNRISAKISPAQKTKALKEIELLRKLLPFLIHLSDKEKQALRKMGPKSVDYVTKCMKGAQQNKEIIPAAIDMAEFEKDVALVQDLFAIQLELQKLSEGIDNTIMAAGSDAMTVADDIYGYLQNASKKNANIKALVSDIGRRFEGQGKKNSSGKNIRPAA